MSDRQASTSVSEQRYDAFGQLVENRSYATAVGHLTGYDELTIAAAILPDTANDRRSAIAYRRRATGLHGARTAGRIESPRTLWRSTSTMHWTN